MSNSDNQNKGELAKVLWYYNLIPDTHTTNQKIVCPFHDDVNPSMLVDLSSNSWFCFGCNKSGDAIQFVKLFEKQYNGLNDLQAYKKYLKILKSNKCSKIVISKSQDKSEPFKRDLYNQGYDYYHGLKKVNWNNSDEPEVIRAKSYMIKRGFDANTLIDCGAKVTYSYNYEIIFPMLDNGKFKGYVCRTMRKKIEEKRKYLYNDGFRRRNTLVGNYTEKDKYVFIVEGYMDWLKFRQFGIKNVVAILGWKMSNQQIEKLKSKGIKNIISALDNDQYGRQGTKYLENFFNVTRFQYLKGIKDPGEMNKNNFEKMLKRTIKMFKETHK